MSRSSTRLAGILVAVLAITGTAGFAAVAAPDGDAQAPGERLGRLFFTPERRAALDRQRQSPPRDRRDSQAMTITVNGVVRRAAGPETAWINGVPQTTGAAGGLWTGSLPRQPGSIRLNLPGETPRHLRIGETLQRDSGEVESPLHGGRISIRRAPPPSALPARR